MEGIADEMERQEQNLALAKLYGGVAYRVVKSGVTI